MIRAWTCAGALLLFGACSGSGTLVVQVRTDLVPVGEFTEILTTITPLSGGEPIEASAAASGDLDWGGGVRVAEAVDIGTGDYLLSVRAVNGARVIVERPVRVQIEGDGIRVVTVLLTRDCAGVTCPRSDAAATACLGGRCVPDTCVEEEADTCGTPDCRQDSECSATGFDGCADLRCTTSGTCFAAPSRARCGADQVCHVRFGCRDAGGGLCTGTPCGLVPQCGCDAGTACYIDSASVRCLAEGTAPEGAPCDYARECLAGLTCVLTNGVGECARMCVRDVGCGPDQLCYRPTGLPAGYCRGEACDLFTGAGCDSAAFETCSQVIDTDVLHDPLLLTECRSLGEGLEGTPCATQLDCGESMHCTGTCQWYCESSAGCQTGAICGDIGFPASAAPGACTTPCDPVRSTGCPSGRFACYLFPVLEVPSGASVVGTACMDSGGLALGATCTEINECTPGTHCIGGRCVEGCVVPDGTCSGTLSCSTRGVMFGTEEFGICE